jgi:hypothetical protein
MEPVQCKIPINFLLNFLFIETTVVPQFKKSAGSIFNKYKTFSVLMIYRKRVEIGKTTNCVETRRPEGGVFSHNFEFSQFPRVYV